MRRARSAEAHVQVSLPDPDGAGVVEVDAGMVPLLAALWARGFRTTSSCEGNPGGRAYVALWPYDAAPAVAALLPAQLRAMTVVVGEMITFPSEARADMMAAL